MTHAAVNTLIAVEIDGKTQNMPMIEVAETNTANSIVVAQYFGREHRRVLPDIEALINNTSHVIAEFAARHFLKDVYQDSNGQNRPMYHMTQSGFAKLVSRWSGKEAEEFMVRYIEKFDEMAADNRRLQIENTQLLEQRLERQKEDYRLLKGELSGDTVEFYVNKLDQVEGETRQMRNEIASLTDQVTAANPASELVKGRIRAKASDATAKDMLKVMNVKARQIRAHVKAIRKWMLGNEHEYDCTLLNATEGIDTVVKSWT